MFNKVLVKKIHRLECLVSTLDAEDSSNKRRIRDLESKLKGYNEDLTAAEVKINVLVEKLSALLEYLDLEVHSQKRMPFVVKKRGEEDVR